MKNAKNNHQFPIWKKVVLACSLCLKRIKLTKTSGITFLSQFNHRSTREKESEKEKTTASNWKNYILEDFLQWAHCFSASSAHSERGTTSQSCLKPCYVHPSHWWYSSSYFFPLLRLQLKCHVFVCVCACAQPLLYLCQPLTSVKSYDLGFNVKCWAGQYGKKNNCEFFFFVD